MPDPDVLALAASTETNNRRPPGRVPVLVKRLLCGAIVALALPILALTPRTGGGAPPEPPEPPEPIVAVTPVAEVAAASAPVGPAPSSSTESDTTPTTSNMTSPSTTPAAPATTTWTASPSTRPATTAKPAPTTTWSAPPTTPTTRTNPATPQVTAATFLQCVRSRESGGNYQAVNPSSGTAGAYQFHQATWDQTAGAIGRADLVGTRPDQAAPATQDLVAASLYQSAGAGPWGGGCVPPTDR